MTEQFHTAIVQVYGDDVAAMVDRVDALRDGLRDDGTLWLNVVEGVIGSAWRVAFELQARGWYLRSDIILDLPGADRHYYLFLLAKQPHYFYDLYASREASTDPVGSARRYEMPFFVGPKHEAGGYSADGQKHTAGMKGFDGMRNRRSVWTLGLRGAVDVMVRIGTSEVGVCGNRKLRLRDDLSATDLELVMGWLGANGLL